MADDLGFLRDSDSALDADFLTRVRRQLRLPQQAQLKLAGVHADSEGGCSIEYVVTVPVQLRGSEYGIADGVTVDEQTSARLSFNAVGKHISTLFDGIDERHLELVRDQVKKLAARDQIASARPEADSVKPWYLEKDIHGVRRLKRAQMS